MDGEAVTVRVTDWLPTTGDGRLMLNPAGSELGIKYTGCAYPATTESCIAKVWLLPTRTLREGLAINKVKFALL